MTGCVCPRVLPPPRTGAAAALAVLILAGALPVRAADVPVNDYPTEARADYVFGCMAVNGQTREALRKCSCSIDVIASLIPYSDYEEAETALSIVQKGGEAVTPFRTFAPLREKVNNLRRAQAEGDLRCF